MKFPSETHERLNRLAGLWDTTITALNADGSAGAVSMASDIYTWMPNGQFLMHDVDAVMGSERTQSSEIFAVDAAGHITSRSYDADGSMNDFTATLDGSHYTITGETQRFSGAFSADGQKLEGRWEQHDGANWLPFVSIVLLKKA